LALQKKAIATEENEDTAENGDTMENEDMSDLSALKDRGLCQNILTLPIFHLTRRHLIPLNRFLLAPHL
jgi:hypothetical protein